MTAPEFGHSAQDNFMLNIMASFAEVASQFSEPGGAYLYVRTAFGRFAGLQVGWFWLLAVVGGAAASEKPALSPPIIARNSSQTTLTT